MMKLPLISHADLVRALHILQPPDDTVRGAIADLLGLTWQAPVATDAPQLHSDLFDKRAAKREAPAPPPEVFIAPPPPEPGHWIASTIEAMPDDVKSIPPGWYTNNQYIRPAADTPAQPTAGAKSTADWYRKLLGPPPLEPLLKPNWTRAILSAALATRSDEGALDIDAIVERLSRGEALDRLLLLPETTLRRGVQLLVDRSQSLEPYTSDQKWLQNKIIGVAGSGNVNVMRFTGTPLRRAGTGIRSDWRPYHSPPTGTVVVLLTDLSIGAVLGDADAALPEEWAAFAALLRAASCPLIAFVPYGSARWPALLAQQMALIEWNRPTTAAAVRRRVGKAHEVHQ